MELKYHAIILSKFNISETDCLYTVFTLEAGKVSVLAKGVRKPKAKLAGVLEPITYSEIFLARNRGKGKITGAICVNNFSQIKNDLKSLENVFYVFKLLNKLVTQEEKDVRVFNLLLNYLEILENMNATIKDDEKKDLLTLGFTGKFLEALGYGIQTEKCVNCTQSLVAGENYFSAQQGGILCLACSRKESNKIKISDGTIKLMRVFLRNKMENFEKIKVTKKILINLKTIINESLRWIDT